MDYLERLSVGNLVFRGLGTDTSTLSRLYKSLDEALLAVENGEYVPNPLKLNTVIIAGQGNLSESIHFYSFDLETFVPLFEFQNASNQASKYILLDGNDGYIGFDNAGAVLDFSQDWTIGHTLVGLQGPSTSNKMTLYSRGGVHITLQALEIQADPDQEAQINWGLYVTGNNDLFNVANRAQANTWYAPGNFSRILFTYCATTKYLKYYIGNTATGTYALRANLAIPQSMIDGQDINGGLRIGGSWVGTGGSNFSGINWRGGVNNLIGGGVKFNDPYVQDYFQNQSVDPDNPTSFFTSASFWDDLDFYCKVGEDTYPDVTDEKGFLTGGQLVNGSADDFKDMPTQ